MMMVEGHFDKEYGSYGGLIGGCGNDFNLKRIKWWKIYDDGRFDEEDGGFN
jgi:hypothetical protein